MRAKSRIRTPLPRLYFDPVDELAPGKAVLITSQVNPWMRKRGVTVERCLLGYLGNESPEDVLFRRVDEKSPICDLMVWEVDSTRASIADRGPRRLLGCFHPISTFARTVRIDEELGRTYGIVEVYVRSDKIAGNFSYLDRTGKVRPLYLVIDGEAVEEGAPEEMLRGEIEDAIPQALEPVFQYPP